MDRIAGINNSLNNVVSKGSKPVRAGESFADRFKTLIEEVNTKQHTADESTEKVIKGELGIHEGMLSINEADVSLKYFIKVREKVMQAYNEVRKMPV